jgi:hypothetical protein
MPLIVHKEGAAVGDKGRIRVALLLVLVMLPPPPLCQRFCPRLRRTHGGCGFYCCRARLEVDYLGLLSIIADCQPVHHDLCFFHGGEGSIRAGDGRGRLAIACILPRLRITRAIRFPFRLPLCERGRAIDFTQVAVVGIGVFVDIAQY